MARKHDKQVEKQLIDIVNNRSNGNRCGECGSDYPTWASYNLGILLCGRCANVHKKVLSREGPRGGSISKVKSLTLEHWSRDEIDQLKSIGNKKAKSKWNTKREPFPHDDDDDTLIEEYMRDKYIYGRFRNDGIQDDDYDRHASRYSDDSGRLTPMGRRSRLSTVTSATSRPRANSRQVPRLTHRQLTQFERSQYQNLVNKLVSFGYLNRDAALESLILSNGDVELAVDILDHDSKTNPTQAELPPDLPRRPSQPAAAPAPSQNDWWSGQSQPTQALQQQQTAAPPQIYQYTDPITGQVSYIDANGQQYLDPNNPQHQTLLYQQTNPQLVAQQTNKQNIMSLYNQPESFTTNVSAPVGAGQQVPQQQFQQQQLQQQQLQQQQLQQQQTQATGFLGFGYAQQPQPQQQTGYYMAQPQQQQYTQPQQQYWR